MMINDCLSTNGQKLEWFPWIWYESAFLGMFGQRRSHHAVYACVFSTGQKMHLLRESVFVFFFFKYKYDNLNLILESGAMMPNLAAKIS